MTMGSAADMALSLQVEPNVGSPVIKRNALVNPGAGAHLKTMGRTADYSNQTCSVAATLEVVGDPWTLLILRDAFLGVNRFEQWRDRLGVARNVLAYRLKALVAGGLMERAIYCTRPTRYEYVLTDKGRDIYPVLMTLRAWGDRHVYG